MQYDPIKFELSKDDECLTPCPFGVGHSDEYYEFLCSLIKQTFPKAKAPLKTFLVNSGFCQDCEHYHGVNDKECFVLCSYHFK